MHLLMRPKKKMTATCSYCGKEHIKGYHSSTIVIAEDHPISGRRVFLHIRKRKYRCPEDGKIHIEDTPWLKLFSIVTNRFAKQVSRLTAITTNTNSISRQNQ